VSRHQQNFVLSAALNSLRINLPIEQPSGILRACLLYLWAGPSTEEFVKKIVELLLCLVALCGTALFAQESRNTAHPRMVRTTEKSQIHVPAQDAPAGLKGIYSNLGPKADAYNGGGGFLLRGPAAGNFPVFVAMPFTPKSNSTVMEVEAAVQYGGSGANQVNLSLYGDSGGVPGTLLAGPQTVANLPHFGSCCTLTIWKLATGVKVTGGSQYWVVADTPASGVGSDFFGNWDFVFRTHLTGMNTGSHWYQFTGPDQEVAGAVFGTVP
jgi:hypothetical protein